MDVHDHIRKTYFALRLGLVVLAVLLALAIVVQLVRDGCLQSSISAFYYTPVRSVFVAALCAIGAGLIMYRGNSTTENALLDVAGFVAFIVAFVPAGFRADAGCPAVAVPDVRAAIVNNMLALIVAGGVGLALARVTRRSREAPPVSTVGAMVACAALWAVLFVTFIVAFDFFLLVAHAFSAITFFVLVLIVIFLNARSFRADEPRIFQIAYTSILVGVVVAAVALAVARFLFPLRTFIFWLEAVGIAGFLVFWLVQTLELRGYVDRDQKRADPAA